LSKRPQKMGGSAQKAVHKLTPFSPIGAEAEEEKPTEAAPAEAVVAVAAKAAPEKPIATAKPRRGRKAEPEPIAAFAEAPAPDPAAAEAAEAAAEASATESSSALESETWALEPLESAVAGIATHLSQIETAPGTAAQADGSGMRRLSLLQGLVARLRHDAWTRTQAMLDAAEVEIMHNPGSPLADPVRRRANMVRVALDANAQAIEALLGKSTRQQKSQSRQEQRTMLLGGVLVASVATLAFLLRSMPVPASLHLALGSLSAAGCAALLAWAGRLFVRDWRHRVPPPHVAGVSAALQVLRQPGTTDAEACAALIPLAADLAALEATGDAESGVAAFAARAVVGCARPLGMPWPGAATIVRHSLEPAQPGRWMGAHEYATILDISGVPYGYDQADATALEMADRPPTDLLARLGLVAAA
jgi:hypothetical protein